MSHTIELPDESTRPKAPKIEGVTPRQRAHGRQLALIHDLYLRQLAQVREIMELMAGGEESLRALGAAVASLPMAQNYRAFGTLCGRECKALMFHHAIEEQHLFPALARDGLRRVVERLREEHRVVHRLLEHLQACVDAAIESPGPETFGRLCEAFEALERTVKSHFGYEQEELEEAIGYWNVPL